MIAKIALSVLFLATTLLFQNCSSSNDGTEASFSSSGESAAWINQKFPEGTWQTNYLLFDVALTLVGAPVSCKLAFSDREITSEADAAFILRFNEDGGVDGNAPEKDGRTQLYITSIPTKPIDIWLSISAPSSAEPALDLGFIIGGGSGSYKVPSSAPRISDIKFMAATCKKGQLWVKNVSYPTF